MDSARDSVSPGERSAAVDAPPLRGRVLRVGRWQFDRSLNTLACGDELVRVEPKVADLLHAFLRRPRQVLSRAELLDAVWPGVVVGDEALSQSINKLRRALGDTTRDGTYLQTVPKRGYRLIAQVAEVAEVADTVETAGAAEPEETTEAEESDETRKVAKTSATARLTANDSSRAQARHARLAGGRRWSGRPILALAILAAAAFVAIAWFALGRKDADDLSAILARAAIPAGAQSALPEVLVRPFDVIGPDGAANAMARALWMQAIASIAQSSQLRVIAQDRTPPPAGQATISPLLYQVDGTVQQFGERLAIHLVLSNTSSHLVLWSRRFDLPLSDLSAGNQRAIAGLLQALAVTLTESERARMARPYTSSARAFQHFLAGQAAFATRDPQSNLDARAHYRRALAEDPTFARAMAGIALTYAADATFGWAADRQAAIRQALDSARQALALDPDQPDVHWVLAWVELQGRRHAQALSHARRAIDLNPSYADAYALAATVASYVGRPADALVLMRAAARLRPDPGFLYHLVLGRASFFLDDDAQAIASLSVSLRQNPGFLESRVYLAAALSRSGRLEDARWEAEEIRAHEPGFSAREWIAASLLTDRGEIAKLARALEPLGLEAQRDSQGVAGEKR
jgi:DNA-binding winged helix-turn-helix (wHTH) protein/TolB-like protein